MWEGKYLEGWRGGGVEGCDYFPACGRTVETHQRRLAPVRTDVSQEHIAPIIRVKGISDLGTALAVTSN
jgi:hypothetical protein